MVKLKIFPLRIKEGWNNPDSIRYKLPYRMDAMKQWKIISNQIEKTIGKHQFNYPITHPINIEIKFMYGDNDSVINTITINSIGIINYNKYILGN